MIQRPFVPDLYVISRKQEDILLPNMARVMIKFTYKQNLIGEEKHAEKKVHT